LGELGRSFDEMAASLQAQSRELRKSKQTLEAVLASSPVAIVALDLERKITMWTPAAERLFGWSAAEVLGREMPFTPPEHEEVASALAARAARGEEFVDEEWPAMRKDGSRLLLSVSTAVLVGPDGVRGLVATMMDLTARRQVERQLRHAQKMEALGRLAGGVTHDFNNLLTIIRGFNAMILSRPDLDPATRSDAEQALEAAVRASTLTSQLMAFSRRPPAPPRVVDLNDVVSGMLLMLQRVVGEDIQVETHFLASPPWITVDPGQIEQVLANLVVNAREAMPQGGRLVIETANHECSPDPQKRCRPECPGPSVTLAVSDSGEGIDAATQRHLFEPYFAGKEHGPGAGLGLSTVHGIVQLYGGDVEVLSESGRGSTIRVYLPIAPGPAAIVNGARPAPRGSGTVLLVEDDDAVRALERSMIEHLGYRVLEAQHGKEALEVATRHEGPIELLVTDVVMPEMGGPAVAERLRQMRRGIRVLYLSGYAPGESGRVAESLDAALLSKPFTLDALATKMREALEAPARSPTD
jgi:PAS domain S-box-containing protein